MGSGEYVDDQTGLPVDPKMIQQLDPRSTARQGEVMGGTNLEGEMARENIPANMDMGLDSMMPKRGAGMGTEVMSVEQKIMALMDMGLTQGEAIDAIAMEESAGSINPNAFSGMARDTAISGAAGNMGALGGVPANMPMPMPRGSTNMGMPEDAMVAQRMNQVDTSGMSPQQIEMLRMGRDPFAEGMIGR